MHEIKLGDVYKNNKLGTEYRVLDFALNCTNAQDGQEMIVYTEYDESGNINHIFVRERKEFEEKFTFVRSEEFEGEIN